MRLFLLRHGATEWNLAGKCQGATDVELSPLGCEQAEAAAEALSREKIHAIYSSDLKRALDTAAAVNRFHRLTVVVEARLRELDHGEIEGLTFAEIQARRPDFLRQWRETPADAPIPGGEKLIEVDARAWAALGAIAARHRADDTLVVVSHNFPILAILCRITNTPLNQYRTFHLPPGGMIDLEYRADGSWRAPADGKLPFRDRGKR